MISLCRERVEVITKYQVQEKGYSLLYMDDTRQWKESGYNDDGLCGCF